MNVSAFDSRPRLDNIFGTRGIQGEATFGYSLTDTLSIEAGALYNKQDKRSLYALEQKRVFVSLRYSNPALFRFSK
jgi:hypothetical protein